MEAPRHDRAAFMTRSFRSLDIDAVGAHLRDVAAVEVLPRFRALRAHEVTEKASGDLVTTADVESERALEAALTDLLPGSVAVGEEAAEHNPGVLAALSGDAPVWLIDPVDGTHNFAHGDPRFALIVALVHGGRTRAGWILDPVNDRLAVAEEGGGAWLDGARLQVPRGVAVEAMNGSLARRLRERLAERREKGEAGLPASVVRYRCVGLEYMDLARGALHFARYGGRLKPWDHAAGVLLHGESGGYARLGDGDRDYTPAEGVLQELLLLAPDETAWHTLHRLFGQP